MEKIIDITIRVPEDWAPQFWEWYLDGGGDQGFTMYLDKTECQNNVTWSDDDKKRWLLMHAKNRKQLNEMNKIDTNNAAKKIAQYVWEMNMLDPEETMGDDHLDLNQFKQKVLKMIKESKE